MPHHFNLFHVLESRGKAQCLRQHSQLHLTIVVMRILVIPQVAAAAVAVVGEK